MVNIRPLFVRCRWIYGRTLRCWSRLLFFLWTYILTSFEIKPLSDTNELFKGETADFVIPGFLGYLWCSQDFHGILGISRIFLVLKIHIFSAMKMLVSVIDYEPKTTIFDSTVIFPLKIFIFVINGKVSLIHKTSLPWSWFVTKHTLFMIELVR